MQKKIKIGEFGKRVTCRLCASKHLIKFLDLGNMPHAGNYLSSAEIGKEYYYPLRIYFCSRCKLVQNLDIISPTTLFKKYHYLSSVSLGSHFQKYAEEMKKRFLNKNSFVVEMGSNDGVLLTPLKKMGVSVLGVDPAKNVAKIAEKNGIKTIVDFFGYKVADKILSKYGKADMILANNVLAHIDDMKDVFKGIVKLLKPDGVLVFEVHYLPDLLSKMQYDFFYSEHLSYYSLSSLIPFLSAFGLEIFDVKKFLIHSGSIRVYVQFRETGQKKVRASVSKLLSLEKVSKMFTEKYLKIFSKNVYKHGKEIKKVLLKVKKDGNKIAGYGAGGRANTILNFCGIDNKLLDYIVDDSPERQGRFTPGTHIPIFSPNHFRKDRKVKYALLLAWNYKERIMRKESAFLRGGGRFVIPFPKIMFSPQL